MFVELERTVRFPVVAKALQLYSQIRTQHLDAQAFLAVALLAAFLAEVHVVAVNQLAAQVLCQGCILKCYDQRKEHLKHSIIFFMYEIPSGNFLNSGVFHPQDSSICTIFETFF